MSGCCCRQLDSAQKALSLQSACRHCHQHTFFLPACLPSPPTAADLARDLRETKLETDAQPPARFVEVVVSASGPASAPSSPGTRSRQGRKRGFTTAAALV